MDDHAARCLKLLREDPQFALDPTAELLVHLLRLGQVLEPDEVAELGEVGEGLMNLGPLALVCLYVLHHLVPSPELVEQDALGGFCHIVRGVHRREGRGDHWHDVLPVRRVRLRIPHLEIAQAGNILGLDDVTQHNWLRPVPLVIYAEESVDELARCVVRIELADTRNQESPRDPAEEAEHVGVDATPSGPTLHEAQRLPEGLTVWDQLQNLVGDAVPIHAPNTLVVHALEHLVFVGGILWMLAILEGRNQPCEKEVDADTSHLQLDDRRKRVRNGHTLRDALDLFQLVYKVRKEGLAAHMRRPDAKRVDVAPGVHHAEPVGAEGDDFHGATLRLILRHAILDAHLRYPSHDNALELLEHGLSMRHALGRLLGEFALQLLHHLLAQHTVCFRRLLQGDRLGDAILHERLVLGRRRGRARDRRGTHCRTARVAAAQGNRRAAPAPASASCVLGNQTGINGPWHTRLVANQLARGRRSGREVRSG
mmetsp:Transcript_119757/g.255538  ORF Transcript_119757/g.255538 Transcript_119757/m.255538 type:complete len:483 (+) Transcript_119757:416-1864(+)